MSSRDAGLWGKWHHLVKKIGKQTVDKSMEYHTDFFGKKPAVISFFDRQIKEDYFPLEYGRALHAQGAIPMVRYYFSTNFKNTAKGGYDDVLKKFFSQAAELETPFILTPYPEININKGYGHPWAMSKTTDWFADAWAQKRKIASEEGAKNAVWGLHYIGFGDKRNYDIHKLPPEFIDLVGFSIFFWSYMKNQSVGYLFRSGYNWAKSTYPSKPIALFEFGINDKYGQGKKIRDSYKAFKKYSRLKLVMYGSFPFGQGGKDSTLIAVKNHKAFREAIADPYYIGAKTS